MTPLNDFPLEDSVQNYLKQRRKEITEQFEQLRNVMERLNNSQLYAWMDTAGYMFPFDNESNNDGE